MTVTYSVIEESAVSIWTKFLMASSSAQRPGVMPHVSSLHDDEERSMITSSSGDRDESAFITYILPSSRAELRCSSVAPRRIRRPSINYPWSGSLLSQQKLLGGPLGSGGGQKIDASSATLNLITCN